MNGKCSNAWFSQKQATVLAIMQATVAYQIENVCKAQLVDLLTTLEDSEKSGKDLENIAVKYFHKTLHQPDKQEMF